MRDLNIDEVCQVSGAGGGSCEPCNYNEGKYKEPREKKEKEEKKEYEGYGCYSP